MPIPSWPGDLPYQARRSGFSVAEPYREPVTTQVEDGPDLRRVAAQTIVKKLAYRMRFTNAQLDTFEAFVRDDLSQGTADFTMQALVGAATYESRRVYIEGGKYQASPQGRDWQVTFTLCVFPPA